MLFEIKSYERKIFELIKLSATEMGVPAYVVGGYVRDRLLARPSKDLDIVCIGDGIKLAKVLASKLRPMPKIVVYSRFGTAMIRHKDLEIEFVGARKESYQSSSRKPTVNEGNLQDDQNRRDFTINALAVSLNEKNYGELIDPFNGLQDLERKILRTPLEPSKTFSDDPLRMMRGIRFSAQLDFKIEERTFNSITENKQRIKIVSSERITIELEKILMSPIPSKGFLNLHKTGLLKLIIPEFELLKGVEFRNGIGHKDNFYHSLEVLDNIARRTQNKWLRWAALLHDIAKPQTKRFDEKLGWTFHGHENLGAAMATKIFRRLRLPMDHKLKYVQKLILLHLRPIALTKDNISDAAVRRLLFDAGDQIDDLLTLCQCDITSKNEKKVKRYLSNFEHLKEKIQKIEEKDRLRNWQPPIDGNIIMNTFNLRPNKEVGVLKKAIREAILDGEIPNEYDAAYNFMMLKAAELGLKPNCGENI